ncbi:MAG: hypothetical protein ABI609_08700 [Acidobacteriota bacterium]
MAIALPGTSLAAVQESAPATTPAPAAEPADDWTTGIAAYERGDFAAYQRAFEALAKVAPEHPMVLARLASAYALNGKPAEAIGVLSRLADRGVWTEVSPTNDFKSLANVPEAAGLRLRLQSLRDQRVGLAEVAFRISDTKLVPEGVAFDARTGAFLISSQYERKIVRRSSSGEVRDLVGPAQDGLWMAMGIAADAAQRTLWVASVADESMQGVTAEDAGRTALFAFDLDSGRLKRKLLPPPGTDSTFDDVALGAAGAVYVSDSASGTIFTATADARRLDVLIPPGQLGSPQGMALSADGQRLYVSDYGRGIFAIELRAGIVIRLRVPEGMALLGFDGLQRSGNCLVAVQNGLEPNKVLSLHLTSDGLGIDRTEVLEMNTPWLDEPTLGTVTPDGFVFVANSGDGKFRKAKGDFNVFKPSEPLLLRIPAGKLCPEKN